MKTETRIRQPANTFAEAYSAANANEEERQFRNQIQWVDSFENAPLRHGNRSRANADLDFAKMGLAVVNSHFRPEHIQKLVELVEKSEVPLYFFVEAKDDGQIATITSYQNKADWLTKTEASKGWMPEEVWNSPPFAKDRQLAFLRTQLEGFQNRL